MFDIIDFILYYDASVKYYCLGVVISIFLLFLIIRLSIEASVNAKMQKEDEDYDLIDQYEYSKQNRLCIFDDCIRICRAGVFVSNCINNVLNVTCSNDEHDRVLYVEYAKDKNHVVRETIHCGPMDYFQYMKLKELIMKNAGGATNG